MMKRTIAFIIAFCVLSALASCGVEKVDPSLVETVTDAAEKTNAIKKYSASFLLEVTDADSGELILFANGNYDADLTGALIMSGSMVQNVNGSPSSLYMAYNDGKYYAKSGDYSTFTEISEDIFRSQFLCAEALAPKYVTSIESKSNGSGGTIYYFKADVEASKGYLLPLIDTEVFYYNGVKKIRTDTLNATDLSGEYVVDEQSGLLKSRTIEYTETVYDTAPYYPNGTKPDEELLSALRIKIKQTYKTLDGTTSVVLPDFALNGE